MSDDAWRIWDSEHEYGELFRKRLVGIAPEMESSKVIAGLVSSFAKSDDSIADIGCGTAHYLRSLARTLQVPFSYHGVDQTQHYVDLANENLHQIPESMLQSAKIVKGDLFGLPISDKAMDIVICSNVLLHLPSIEKPLSELTRITKETLILRTLVGQSSFIIKQVKEPEVFNEKGDPRNFYYLNIYSESYLKDVLSECGFKNIDVRLDIGYDLRNIDTHAKTYMSDSADKTTILNKMQVNQYIIQPWAIVTATR